MGTAILVQVRLDSTRLPRKALLPLAGATVISHVMRSLAPVPADWRALITDEHSAEAFASVAAAEGWAVFVGHATDVLARFCAAARAFGADTVVRATGDNPLTSGELARAILALHRAADADLSHFLGNPWGTGVEAVRAAALFAAESGAVLPEEREHATTWLYRNRSRWRIIEPSAPAEAFLPDARLSIDTAEDYERVQAIFAALYDGRPLETARVVRWLGGPAHG